MCGYTNVRFYDDAINRSFRGATKDHHPVVFEINCTTNYNQFEVDMDDYSPYLSEDGVLSVLQDGICMTITSIEEVQDHRGKVTKIVMKNAD